MAQAEYDPGADDLHKSIIAASFVPGPTGMAADFADAGLSAYKGDYLGMGLGAAAGVAGALPMFGAAIDAIRAARAGSRFESIISAARKKLRRLKSLDVDVTDDQVLDIIRNMDPEVKEKLQLFELDEFFQLEQNLAKQGHDPSLAKVVLDSDEDVVRVDPRTGKELGEHILQEAPGFPDQAVVPMGRGEGIFSDAIEGQRERTRQLIEGQADEVSEADLFSSMSEGGEESTGLSKALEEAQSLTQEDEVIPQAFLSQVSGAAADSRGRAGQPILTRDVMPIEDEFIETDFHRWFMESPETDGARREFKKKIMIETGNGDLLEGAEHARNEFKVDPNAFVTDDELRGAIAALSPDEVERLISTNTKYDPAARAAGGATDVPLAEPPRPPALPREPGFEGEVLPITRDVDALREGDPEGILQAMARDDVTGIKHNPQTTIQVSSEEFDGLVKGGSMKAGGKASGIDVVHNGPLLRDQRTSWPPNESTDAFGRGQPLPIKTKTGEFRNPKTEEIVDPDSFEIDEWSPDPGVAAPEDPATLAETIFREQQFPGRANTEELVPREVGIGEQIVVVDSNDPSRKMVVKVNDFTKRSQVDPNTGQLVKEDRAISVSRVPDEADAVIGDQVVTSQAQQNAPFFQPGGAPLLTEGKARASLDRRTVPGPGGRGVLRKPAGVDGYFPEDVAREIESHQNLYGPNKSEGGFKWADSTSQPLEEQGVGVLTAVDPLTDAPAPKDFGWASTQGKVGPYSAAKVLENKSLEELEEIARFIEDAGQELPLTLREALTAKDPSGKWLPDDTYSNLRKEQGLVQETYTNPETGETKVLLVDEEKELLRSAEQAKMEDLGSLATGLDKGDVIPGGRAGSVLNRNNSIIVDPETGKPLSEEMQARWWQGDPDVEGIKTPRDDLQDAMTRGDLEQEGVSFGEQWAKEDLSTRQGLEDASVTKMTEGSLIEGTPRTVGKSKIPDDLNELAENIAAGDDLEGLSMAKLKVIAKMVSEETGKRIPLNGTKKAMVRNIRDVAGTKTEVFDPLNPNWNKVQVDELAETPLTSERSIAREQELAEEAASPSLADEMTAGVDAHSPKMGADEYADHLAAGHAEDREIFGVAEMSDEELIERHTFGRADDWNSPHGTGAEEYYGTVHEEMRQRGLGTWGMDRQQLKSRLDEIEREVDPDGLGVGFSEAKSDDLGGISQDDSAFGTREAHWDALEAEHYELKDRLSDPEFKAHEQQMQDMNYLENQEHWNESGTHLEGAHERVHGRPDPASLEDDLPESMTATTKPEPKVEKKKPSGKQASNIAKAKKNLEKMAAKAKEAGNEKELARLRKEYDKLNKADAGGQATAPEAKPKTTQPELAESMTAGAEELSKADQSKVTQLESSIKGIDVRISKLDPSKPAHRQKISDFKEQREQFVADRDAIVSSKKDSDVSGISREPDGRVFDDLGQAAGGAETAQEAIEQTEGLGQALSAGKKATVPEPKPASSAPSTGTGKSVGVKRNFKYSHSSGAHKGKHDWQLAESGQKTSSVETAPIGEVGQTFKLETHQGNQLDSTFQITNVTEITKISDEGVSFKASGQSESTVPLDEFASMLAQRTARESGEIKAQIKNGINIKEGSFITTYKKIGPSSKKGSSAADEAVESVQDTLQENTELLGNISSQPKPQAPPSPFTGLSNEDLIDKMNFEILGAMPHMADAVNKERQLVIQELKRRGAVASGLEPPV